MIGLRFGKGQGFAHETADTLTKRTIPTFLMSRLTSFLANKMMRALREDGLIGLPEIAVGTTAAVGARNGVPQLATTVCTAVPQHKGDNLARPATQGCPQPDGVVLAFDEGPQFIDLQHITALLGQQTVHEARQALHLRLNPFHRRLAGNAVDTTQPAQAGPFCITAQHVLAALSLIIRFWLQYAVCPAVFAVVLCLADFVRPILDDVLAAAHPAFVRFCHLDHPAYSGLSLTTLPRPKSHSRAFRSRKRQGVLDQYPQ